MIIDTEFNSAAQVPAKICADAAALAEERGFAIVLEEINRSGGNVFGATGEEDEELAEGALRDCGYELDFAAFNRIAR